MNASDRAKPWGTDIWRYVKLLFGGVLLTAVLVFATQNADPVTVRVLFAGRFELSLSLLLFLVLLAGILVGVILGGWLRWRRSHRRAS